MPDNLINRHDMYVRLNNLMKLQDPPLVSCLTRLLLHKESSIDMERQHEVLEGVMNCPTACINIKCLNNNGQKLYQVRNCQSSHASKGWQRSNLDSSGYLYSLGSEFFN